MRHQDCVIIPLALKLLNTYNENVMFLVAGVRMFENVKVTGVQADSGKVSAVETNQGRIECQYFVNAAGMVPLLCLSCLHKQHVYTTCFTHGRGLRVRSGGLVSPCPRFTMLSLKSY